MLQFRLQWSPRWLLLLLLIPVLACGTLTDLLPTGQQAIPDPPPTIEDFPLEDLGATATAVQESVNATSTALYVDAINVQETAYAESTALYAATLDADSINATSTALYADWETPTEEPTATRPASGGGSTAQATVVFRECRGLEGTIIFHTFEPSSLHAFQSKTYTVAPGSYPLRIDWLNNPQHNVDTIMQIRSGNNVFNFGDDCR